jgi:hypothetical protein
MKGVVKFLIIAIFLFSLMGLFSNPVLAQASGATLVLSPATQSVKVGTNFTVTILIKSPSEKRISYARALLLFDPTKLEITGAESGDIFCSYPTDEANYFADNVQGQLMVTGISSGTTNCAYPQATAGGIVFATITFKAKITGTAALSFVYNGKQADDQSGITDTNSPPQFIMSAPQDGSYSIILGTPTPTVPPNLGVDPRISIGGLAVAVVILWVATRRKQNGPRVIATTEV